MEIIIFVAWDGAQERSHEKVKQAFKWAKKGNLTRSKSSKDVARIFTPVVYHPHTEDEDLKRMQTGQIYILGHGAEGFGAIGDIDGQIDDPTVTLLSADQVATRLIDSGLKPAFMGDIKLFNCHSATRTNGENSFADLFATAMWEREYTHCRIFGYEDSVEAAYKNRGFGKLCKHVHMAGYPVAQSQARDVRRERTVRR